MKTFILISSRGQVSLKGLCHGQKCLHLFSDSEAYHEQMGPIRSSTGSLDIALSNAHTQSPRQRTFQTIIIDLEIGN